MKLEINVNSPADADKVIEAMEAIKKVYALGNPPDNRGLRLSSLELEVKMANIFHANGWITLGDIAAMSFNEFLKTPRVGSSMARKVEALLYQFGLTFKE